jgi:hypothetical protein
MHHMAATGHSGLSGDVLSFFMCRVVFLLSIVSQTLGIVDGGMNSKDRKVTASRLHVGFSSDL